MSNPTNPECPPLHARVARFASGPVLSVLIPLVGVGAAAGCSDGDTEPSTTGGASSGAKGGAAGNAGKGGTSGKGGASGNSGGEAGGASGAGGTGASGGTGGGSGATGGSGAQSGKGGKGGKGGTGGDTAAVGGTGASGEMAGAAGDDGVGGDGAGAENGGAAGAETGGAAGAGPELPVTIQKVFSLSTTGPDRFFGVTYGPDGSIYAVGQIAISNDTTADQALLLAKFTPAGNLDASFGAGGVVVRNVATGTNGEIYRGVVVQSTGKIVVAGTVEDTTSPSDARDRDIAVLRFNADGTNDTSFGSDGVVVLDLSAGTVNGSSFAADSAWGLERYPDDRLVVHGGQVRAGGTDLDFALVRLKADGTRDGSFGTDGVVTLDTQFTGTASDNASPRYVTILPGTDGVVGAGYRPLAGHETAPVLWKVTDAGVLDTTFGVNGVFSDPVLAEQTEAYQGVVQPMPGGGYKLVTTGYGKGVAGESTDLVSLRVTSSGVLDTTYGAGGLVRVDIGGFGDNSRRLVVLPDRRILIVGGGRLTSADVDGIVMVLTPDGVADSSFEFNGWRRFDLGGPADLLWDVAISPDQKTAALAGIRGVGNTPNPPSANDDAALVLLPLP